MTGAPAWAAFGAALDEAAEKLGHLRFWLRDDDAVAPSAALDRLLALTAERGVPLSLAVIPAGAEPALARRLQRETHVSVLQHGHSHANHAAMDAKKSELGADRPLEAVLDDLREGWLRLESFPAVLPMLVPPWNRITAGVERALPGIGFAAVSRYGERALQGEAGIARLNTHIDPVDWHGGRGFLGEEPVLSALVARLQRLAEGRAERSEPTGILTHHLVHDAKTFAFLERLFAIVADHPFCHWQSVESLLGLGTGSQRGTAP